MAHARDGHRHGHLPAPRDPRSRRLRRRRGLRRVVCADADRLWSVDARWVAGRERRVRPRDARPQPRGRAYGARRHPGPSGQGESRGPLVARKAPTSYWIDSTSTPHFPRLEKPVEVDVAVLGAGIAGITVATLLKEAGKTVALLESKEVLRGVTGYTTAKLTSGHTLVYSAIRSAFGPDEARLYAEANEAAIQHVRRVAKERGIDCDLETAANYVYTESAEEVQKIRDEVEAAKAAGLDVSFVTETPLPFPVAGALRQENQSQFHARKYL